MIVEESRFLRSIHRKNIRETQIKRIKDNIRQTYVERQSKHYIKRSAICKICEELEEEEHNCYRSINEIAYDSLAYHESFCENHEKQIVDLNLEKCFTNLESIWKPYRNINWVEATLPMLKRSLNFMTEILVSLNTTIYFDNDRMVEVLMSSSFVEALLNETIEYTLTKMEELDKVERCYLMFLKNQANLCIQLIIMNLPWLIMEHKDGREVLERLYDSGGENRNICISVMLEILKQDRVGGRIGELINSIIEQTLNKNYKNVEEVKEENVVLELVLVEKLLTNHFEHGQLSVKLSINRIEEWLMNMKNVVNNLGYKSREGYTDIVGHIGDMICRFKERNVELMEEE